MASSESLRVALVTGNYNSVADGAALTLNRFAAFLARSGVPVKVFAPPVRKPAFPPGADLAAVPSVRPPGSAYPVALGLLPSARRELRRFAPTLVHLHAADWLGFSVQHWARLRNIPAVAT